MTTNDKLDIINRWTYEFDIGYRSDGKAYGRITNTSYATLIMTTRNYKEISGAIDQAYEMVYNYIAICARVGG